MSTRFKNVIFFVYIVCCIEAVFTLFIWSNDIEICNAVGNDLVVSQVFSIRNLAQDIGSKAMVDQPSAIKTITSDTANDLVPLW